MLITWATPKLVAFTGIGQEALGWQFAMTVYGVLAVIIFINLFAQVRERFDTALRPGVNAFQDIMDLLRSPPWLALAAAGFVVMMATALHTGVSSYYIKYLAGRPDLMTAFAMCYGLGLAAGSAASSRLAALLSRRIVIAASLGLTALAGVGLYLIPSGNIALIFALQVVTGIALGPVSTLTFAMYADTADVNAVRNGRRATAMTFSGIMSVKKVGAAIAAAMIGWGLSARGFEANVAASPAPARQYPPADGAGAGGAGAGGRGPDLALRSRRPQGEAPADRRGGIGYI
ncbi:MAG: MFS transporter [Asticcacaulis sp.]